MRRTRFDDWPCPIARTTDLIGDWWTPLVLREMFSGRRRFAEIQTTLGIPRAVLAARLDRLVDEDMVRRVEYEQHPPRFEYRLTEKGIDYYPVLLMLLRWGDKYYVSPEGPPLLLRHKADGHDLEPAVTCSCCGQPVEPHAVEFEVQEAEAPRELQPA